MASIPPVSGEGSVSTILVDADNDLLGALDRLEPRAGRGDELLFHVAGFHRLDRAAHVLDALELLFRLALKLLDLGVDHHGAVEQVAILQEVGLVGENLLHAQRPLLVPRPRQPKRFVPGRKLDCPCARFL